MNEFDEYEFHLDAYSPATIPMERLALYMAQLAKLLASQDSVHFQELREGSTVLVSIVEREAAPKVARRLEGLAKGDAGNDESNCFRLLNGLLRDDNAIGKLVRKAPRTESATILRFPGREEIRPPKLGPFTEPATVEGELVRIGGRDATAHAQLLDAEGRPWIGEMNRDTAQKLAPYLYKGPILRVSGDARWERTEEGSWRVISFRIESFEVLADDTLEAAAKRLRAIEGGAWNVEDLDDVIRQGRNDHDGLH